MPRNPTAKNEVPPEKKKREEVRLIERDIEVFSAVDDLAESEGGKVLVDNLARDIIGLVETIGVKYKTASHAELLGVCADLDNKTTILRLITRAKKNKELAIDALKEELARVPTDE